MFWSKSLSFLLNKNINWIKNGKSHKLFLKEAKFASVQESQIKNKTVMSWNLWKKKG